MAALETTDVPCELDIFSIGRLVDQPKGAVSAVRARGGRSSKLARMRRVGRGRAPP